MHLTCGLTTALFLSPLVSAAAGMYAKNSPVIQLDGKSYERLIVKSNYTSMVEFYAPWCGHCQNLKPAYEKAATALDGYAKVAAVNCDEEENKPFCGQMGVQGFPTLKIVKPAKKAGSRPVAEDYQGPRTAKAINEALLDKMPNHVKKLTDKTLDEWLAQGNESAKGVLFTDKAPVSPLMKALAIDFLDGIGFAQIKSSEKDAVAAFGISSFPTMLLLPGGTKDAVAYAGDLKKTPLVEFFSQASAPNPDPAPASASKPKAAKKSSKKDAPKDKTKAAESDLPKGHPPADGSSGECPFSKGSASQKAAEASAGAAPGSTETLDDTGSPPTESPDPNIVTDDTPAPVQLPVDVAPLPSLDTAAAMQTACFTTQSSTCILALLPPASGADADAAGLPEPARIAVAALEDIAHKHKLRGASVFPFYTLPATNAAGMSLGVMLGLYDDGLDKGDDGLRIVAVNAKRKWWRGYPVGADGGLDKVKIESWVDDIRFGDFVKEMLPDEVKIVEGLAKPKKKPEQESPVKVEIVEELDDEHDEL